MKKFLFTLLTLFMASSAFAEGGNYLTMNDYTVVKTKLETKQVSVGVKAHFDNYVSAMQVWVEVPEGVTLRGASAGNDYGISYMDNMGMDKVATPEITFKDGKFVIASMAAAYGDDGDTFYGVAKWAPGDYANYLNFVFRCNADFKGGDVKIIAAPACGDDTRPEVVANRADGTSYTTTSALSVEYIAPEPVLTWDENNYSMTATLPEGYNADDYEIVMMANGVEVQNTYTVDQTSEDQTIEFTAYTKHAADETYDSNDATYGKETKQTVTVPAKVVEQTAKPNIAQENVEGGVKVTATGEGTVKLYVDGVEVDNPYVIAQTDVEKTYTVTATAQEEGKTISETATLEVTVPAKPAQTAKPNIVKEDVEGGVKVTATGEGTVVMYVDGKVVENPYFIAQTDEEKTYTVTATAQKEGELISETATLVVTVPAKPVPVQTDMPVITPEETEDAVIVTATGKGTVVMYVNGVEVDNPVTFAKEEVEKTYTVTATAQEEGKTISETATLVVTVPAKPAPAPEPTFNWDPDTYTMEAVCQGHTVVLMANGAQVSNPYTVAQTTEDQTIEFSAYTVANADESGNSETIKQTVTVPAKPLMELTGEITFSVTQGNKNNEAAGIVTATYNGPETGVTVKIVGDPTKVAAATSEGVRLPDYGTYQVKAIATAEGYADLDGEGEVTWEEPQTAAPEFNVSEDGLTVEATGEGTVTLYIVNADGSETALDNPTTFDQKEEAYTVNLKAVAHVDGAKDGVATKTITIPAKSTEPGTGVNELVDGKAVKSVRYFNMAGQEMQEVNGVTIVVTTYTDGTTSAVKVMK